MSNLFNFDNLSQPILDATVVEREAMQELGGTAVDTICAAVSNSEDSNGGTGIAAVDDDDTFNDMLTYIQGAVTLFIDDYAPANATSLLDTEILERYSSIMDIATGTPVGSWVKLYEAARDAGLVLTNLDYGTSNVGDYLQLALLKQPSYTDMLFFTDASDDDTNRDPVLESLIDHTDTETMREIVAIAKDRGATINSFVTLGSGKNQTTYVYRSTNHASNIILFDVARKFIGKKKK